MNDSPNRRAVIVGLFVFIGLVFFAAGIMMIGNLHQTFKQKIELTAIFPDINGLQAGNNVWFSGVKVGTVKKVNFFERSKVKVTVNVDVEAKKYIRKGAMVKLGTDGLIGNKILVIYGGDWNEEEIMEGDTLKVETAISQEEMMNTLQETNKNLGTITTDLKAVTKKFAAGEGTIGKLLNNDSLYDNMNAASLALNDASGEARHMMKSLNKFSAGLNTQGTLANDLVTDTVLFNSLRSFSVQLQQIGDSTKILISQLKAATNDTSSMVGVILHNREEGERLKVSLRNLETSSKKLDEDLEAAQHSFPLKRYFKKKKNAANNTTAKADTTK